MKGRRTKAPKARRPRAWSNDLEPIAPTCRGEPAWDALATVRLGLHGIVSAALVRRGLDAAVLFIDRGQKGTPWPDPIWPVSNTTGCHLIVAPVRSYRRTLFKLDKKAARHFGLSVDALRRKWLDKWGTVWAAVEEQDRYNQRVAAKREREERREAGGRPAVVATAVAARQSPKFSKVGVYCGVISWPEDADDAVGHWRERDQLALTNDVGAPIADLIPLNRINIYLPRSGCRSQRCELVVARRWALAGVGGRRLRTERVGHRLYTRQVWLNEFARYYNLMRPKAAAIRLYGAGAYR